MNGNLGASSPQSLLASGGCLRPEMQTSPQVLPIYLFICGVKGAHRSFGLFSLDISRKNLTSTDTLLTFFLVVTCCTIFGLGDCFALHRCICADFIVLTGCIVFCIALRFYCGPVSDLRAPPALFSAKITPRFTVS